MIDRIIKKILENAVLFAIGGSIYYMIEIIWKGHSALPMIAVGGVCFIFCGSINEYLSWDILIWLQMLYCMIGVTAVEFLAGYVLNIIMHLAIWDYSSVPFNVLGQICLPFSILWYFLSLPAIILDDYLRYWIFREEKPRYKWR